MLGASSPPRRRTRSTLQKLHAHRPIEGARRSSGGDYVRLSDGVTHFRAEGPAAGVPLILLHGATVPLWEFDLLAPELHASGIRTLRFDLFGHGWSDRPATDYTLELFARQAVELVQAASFPRPAAILGHSVGAAIAARVVALRPEWIARVVLVAPMLDFNASTPWTCAFRRRGIGEWLMRFVGMPALVRRRRKRYARIGQPHLTDRFVEQASYDGFWQALLSMVRSQTLGDQSVRYAALRDLGRELLVISGARDAVVPADDVAKICRLIAEHRRVEIAEAEHNLLLTHPADVAAALRAFLLDAADGVDRRRWAETR
jgi:pimeloyl-ACP methyl ester carboxylesterase